MAFNRIGYGQVEPNQLSAPKTGQIYASLKLDEEVNVLQNGEFMFYDYANNSVNCGKEADADKGVIKTVGEPMLVFNEIKIYEDVLTYKDFAMIRVGKNYVTNRPFTSAVMTAPVDGQTDPYKLVDAVQKTANPADGTVNILRDGEVGIGSQGSYYGADLTKLDNAHTLAQRATGYRMDGIAPRLFKTNVGDIFTTNMVDETKDYALGDILGLAKTARKTLVLCPVADADVTTVQFQVVKDYTMPDGQRGLKLQRIA